MGREVVLVSSAEETAFDVLAILEATGMGRRTAGKPDHRCLSARATSTGSPRWAGGLLGPELVCVEQVAFGAAR